jgi:hypothetical protein
VSSLQFFPEALTPVNPINVFFEGKHMYGHLLLSKENFCKEQDFQYVTDTLGKVGLNILYCLCLNIARSFWRIHEMIWRIPAVPEDNITF